MYFVNEVRRKQQESPEVELEDILVNTMEDCISRNILSEFFHKHGDEVLKMIQLDYTFERQIEMVKRDYKEEGRQQSFTLKASATARYLKLKIKNYGALPSWHISAGQQAWLFIDEIEIQ